MNILYRKTYFFTFIFCLILRGVAWADVEPSPNGSESELTVSNKSVQQIIELANRYSLKDLNLSLAYINLALEKAKAQGDVRQVYNAQREMGFIYMDNSLTKRSIGAFQEALKTAELSASSMRAWADSAFAEIYNDLAIENRKLGNYRAAYDYYDKTIEVAQKTKDFEMVASCYHGLGMLHKEIGVYDRAINYFLRSLEISNQLGAKIDVIVSHNEIADTYLKAKEIEKALSHVEKAYQHAIAYEKENPKAEKANVQLASVLNSYGEILAAQNNYDAALRKHEAALKVYQELNFKPYIAQTLLLIADVQLEKGQNEMAEQQYKRCLEYESQFISRDLANLYFKFGLLNQKQQKKKEAQLAFYKSLQIARKYDFKDMAQKSSYQLFLIHFNDNDKNQALAYLNMANALSDSLFNVEKARRTAEMELKFDIEKRENEIHQYRLRENRFMLIASVVSFLMLVIFLAYTIRMHSRNVKALQSKNEEIQQQYRKLEESNEILSQFAYVAAHDLKEPLRSIGSYIGLIQMRYAKDLPVEGKEYMQFVNNGVKRMYSLLNDLLDFSQVISQQPGCEVVRPDDILLEVKDNLRSAIESKNAQVVFDKDMPSIRMNRLHMTQLLQNLVGNALKFTDKPPVVTVNAKQENGNVILSISDNGIGIKKDYQSKVFVLFQQLNKKGQFDGTGIGLTICKNIVEKYNGKIWFESEENVGTKFYVSLPAQAA